MVFLFGFNYYYCPAQRYIAHTFCNLHGEFIAWRLVSDIGIGTKYEFIWLLLLLILFVICVSQKLQSREKLDSRVLAHRFAHFSTRCDPANSMNSGLACAQCSSTAHTGAALHNWSKTITHCMVDRCELRAATKIFHSRHLYRTDMGRCKNSGLAFKCTYNENKLRWTGSQLNPRTCARIVWRRRRRSTGPSRRSTAMRILLRFRKFRSMCRDREYVCTSASSVLRGVLHDYSCCTIWTCDNRAHFTRDELPQPFEHPHPQCVFRSSTDIYDIICTFLLCKKECAINTNYLAATDMTQFRIRQSCKRDDCFHANKFVLFIRPSKLTEKTKLVDATDYFIFF